MKLLSPIPGLTKPCRPKSIQCAITGSAVVLALFCFMCVSRLHAQEKRNVAYQQTAAMNMPPVFSPAISGMGLATSVVTADAFESPVAPTEDLCQITLEEVVTIGSLDGPGIIERMDATVARDSRGRYYVFETAATAVKVFDKSGAYLTTIGREGGGPGEFKGLSAIWISPEDSLYLFDGTSVRLSVFDPEYRFIRSATLEVEPGSGVVGLGGGRFVLAASIRTPERVGLPLHLVGPEGKVIRSFGSETGLYRPDIPYMGMRMIAPAERGRVWSAFLNRYAIELWDANGRHIRTITREVDWFPPQWRLRYTDITPEEPVPPPPVLTEVREDSQGRLWVLISIADPNWRNAGMPHSRYGLDEHTYYDTMIEVLDPSTGEMLASRRMPKRIGRIMEDGFLAAVIQNDLGVPYVRVWSAELVCPTLTK